MRKPLIEDPFNHIDVDGTPYMWGLRGVGEDGGSAWEVVDGGSGHGLVLKGTASSDSNIPTEAFRGDIAWINDEDETDYMDYSVQADIKLESATAAAGLCLRVRPHYVTVVPDGEEKYVGDRFYALRIDAEDGKIEFGCRRYVISPSGASYWYWEELDYLTFSEIEPPFEPTSWHTLAVAAIGETFECYVDGALQMTVTHTPAEAVFKDGLVGLWVEGESGMFDNVKVVDLR